MIPSGLMVLVVLMLMLAGAITYLLYYKIVCKFIKNKTLRTIAFAIFFAVFVIMLFTEFYQAFLSLLLGAICMFVLYAVYK